DVGILRWVGVPVDGTLLRPADPGDIAEPRNRRALVEELLVREVTQPKELPPRSLVLPTMPVQEMGEEPPRLLLLGALGTVAGNIGGERLHQCSNPSPAFIDGGRRRASPRLWAWERSPAAFHGRAQVLEPLSEVQGRKAVIAIVAFDG